MKNNKLDEIETYLIGLLVKVQILKSEYYESLSGVSQCEINHFFKGILVESRGYRIE